MDKINLQLDSLGWKKAFYNEQLFLVAQTLPIQTESDLVSLYISEYFGEEAIYINHIKAEEVLKLAIIDKCTNVNIDNVEVNDIIMSGLWDIVEKELPFYYQLREMIDGAVDHIKEEIAIQRSINGTLQRIELAITEFLNNISELDLSVDGIKEILSALGKEQEAIDKIIDPSKLN
jgi:hypothetical protein